MDKLVVLFSLTLAVLVNAMPEPLPESPLIELPQPKPRKQLMVVGGFAESRDCSQTAELVPLRGLTCSNNDDAVADLDHGVCGSVGHVFNDGKPTVCGGRMGRDFNANCYKYGDDGAWSKSGALSSGRALMGNDFHPSWGLVASGGAAERHSMSDVVEHTLDGKTFTQLPPLPVSMEGHCMVAIDDKRLFVLGRYNVEEGGLLSAYIYDKSKAGAEWKELDGIPENTLSGHSCFMVPNKYKIMVAGGSNRDQVTDKVRSLDLSSMKWNDEDPLPMPISAASLVLYDHGDILLVGGQTTGPTENDRPVRLKTIVMYNNEEDAWTVLDEKLSTTRAWAQAMLVDCKE